MVGHLAPVRGRRIRSAAVPTCTPRMSRQGAGMAAGPGAARRPLQQKWRGQPLADADHASPRSGRRDWPLSSDESPRRARRTRSRTSSLQCPSGRCLWARGKASMRARSMRDLQGRSCRPRRPPPSRRGRKRTGSSAGALLRSHEPRRTSIARPGAHAPSSTARASDSPTLKLGSARRVWDGAHRARLRRSLATA